MLQMNTDVNVTEERERDTPLHPYTWTPQEKSKTSQGRTQQEHKG